MKTEQEQAEQCSGKVGEELEILTTTGMSMETFRNYVKKHGDAPDSCYLCKRSPSDTTIWLKGNGHEKRIITHPVRLKKMARKVKDIVLEFNLCIECCLLLDSKRDWAPDDDAKG